MLSYNCFTLFAQIYQPSWYGGNDAASLGAQTANYIFLLVAW